MVKTTYFLFFTLLFFSSISTTDAQDRYRVTAQAGVQILSSDHVTSADNEGNRTYVFGLGVSSRKVMNDVPVDFSL